MFELVSEYNQNAEIKVIGVGGGGGVGSKSFIIVVTQVARE